MKTRQLAFLSLAALGFSSCSVWMDEMKIRADQNTILYPDVWEMTDLENREGRIPSKYEETEATEESSPLPPAPVPEEVAGTGALDPGTDERAVREEQWNRASGLSTPEPPLPDTAKDLGIVPIDQIPGLAPERPNYDPALLDRLNE